MYFDSRSERCKLPYGAVTRGTAVSLTVYAEAHETLSAVSVVAHEEFADRWTETALRPLEIDGRVAFHGVYAAPDGGELVWYHFRLRWADGGESRLGKNGVCAADAVQAWQLTVYDASDETPDWFGQGVSYQIFPDRFCRAARRDVRGMVGSRSLHENWDELMDYRPNDKGEITNSDFFGGDLRGVTEKLPYLRSLGVSTLYLNPIFEAASNHRYDTADYRRVDPLLGDEDDFRALCARAEALGIRVMLDGVFNHTGSNSVYFNAKGFYPTVGAAQSKDSPYAGWYRFTSFPDEYDAWWGFKTLPAVREDDPGYLDYICEGADSVVRHWLRAGASGWRLDVADELPGAFIERIRRAMRREKPDAYLIGEVWEDGSNKIAYSQRRKYLLGAQVHGLMNYPFRNALLGYLKNEDAAIFRDGMETIRENYPPAAFYGAMNFLSTHDTPRILTVLGYQGAWPQNRDARAHTALGPAERLLGLARERLASLILYAFPGSPTLFYGDEAGMQGFEDPFNRCTFPWGREDRALTDWYRRLGALRGARESLRRGTLEFLRAEGAVLAFRRTYRGEVSLAVANAGARRVSLELPWEEGAAIDAMTGRKLYPRGGMLRLTLEGYEGLLLIEAIAE
jgi:4-alpha-glucanotransferase